MSTPMRAAAAASSRERRRVEGSSRACGPGRWHRPAGNLGSGRCSRSQQAEELLQHRGAVPAAGAEPDVVQGQRFAGGGEDVGPASASRRDGIRAQSPPE